MTTDTYILPYPQYIIIMQIIVTFINVFELWYTFDSRNEKGKGVSTGTKLTQSLLSKININFLEKRKIASLFSVTNSTD